MKIKAYGNYIDGKWRKSISGKTFVDINPADVNDRIGYFQDSAKEDTKEAIDAARAAFTTWQDICITERARLLKKAVSLFKEKKEEVSKILTREEGKTLTESRAEIDSAVKEIEFQIGQAERLYGETVPSGRNKVFCYTVRQPLGVVSIISPWNFPINVPARKIIPALISGNTVVFKPASITPLSGIRFVEILNEGGLPEGVLNLVTGSGAVVGEEMVANEKVSGVSFTGSNDVGAHICRKAAERLIKVQLEMGGKNPMVVLEDADLESAAADACIGAYSCTGQWCTSTSRVILMRKIAARFTEILLGKVKALKVGNGLARGINMGPLSSESQLKRVLQYIELGRKEGAKLVLGGKRLEKGSLGKGYFVSPAVFDDVKSGMRIAQEEIFGPILCLLKVDSFEEALEVSNKTVYGLSSSIYTRDISNAMEFIDKTQTGLTHVNLPTSYKEPQLPFGGIKDSGVGLPEAGNTGIEFFTEHKTVYIRYK